METQEQGSTSTCWKELGEEKKIIGSPGWLSMTLDLVVVSSSSTLGIEITEINKT